MCMVFKVWGNFTIPTAESVKNARTVIFARVAKNHTKYSFCTPVFKWRSTIGQLS